MFVNCRPCYGGGELRNKPIVPDVCGLIRNVAPRINSCSPGEGAYSRSFVKRSVCQLCAAVVALVLTLGAVGCSGVNTSVPISPLMFMQQSSPPAPGAEAALPLAAHPAPAATL